MVFDFQQVEEDVGIIKKRMELKQRYVNTVQARQEAERRQKEKKDKDEAYRKILKSHKIKKTGEAVEAS